jgi:hypothetical protein
MEQEIFIANDSTQEVKALGVKVDCALSDIHVYINGIDILKVSLIEEIRITYEKKKK